MVSQFTNRFKKKDLDEQRSFQRKVLVAARELFPDVEFTRSEDPYTILSNGQTLGLTNIFAHYLLGAKTDAELRSIVENHLRNVLNATDLIGQMGSADWAVARKTLMPQIVSISYTARAQMVHFPFPDDGLVVGFVLDTANAYIFVTENELVSWNVTADDLLNAAYENLARRSESIEMTCVPGENALAIINTLDGFDAARILLPEIRENIGNAIGLLFYFGIPNRDFLICWAKGSDKGFQNQIRAQIARDFEERPYPLCGKAFLAGPEGEIAVAEAETADVRAAAAENN